MNCRHILNSLSAYLDRELSGEQMMTVRSHLESCSECQTELESLKLIKKDLYSLPLHEPSEQLQHEVMRKVRALEPAPNRRSLSVMVATSVAAAALAVLVFNAFFGFAASPQVVDDGQFDSDSDIGLNQQEMISSESVHLHKSA